MVVSRREDWSGKKDRKEQWGRRKGAELRPDKQCAQWKHGRAKAKEEIVCSNTGEETGHLILSPFRHGYSQQGFDWEWQHPKDEEFPQAAFE